MRKWTRTLVGVLFLGVGVALATIPGMGTDPLAGFDEVLSKMSGITLGRVTSLVELLMIVFCLFLNRSSIGIGTLLSMFLVQFPIDLTALLVKRPDSMVLGLIMIVIGTALIAIGAELIVSGKLGMGPYEAFIYTIGKLINKKFSTAKYVCDGTFLILTILFRGNVGIGTIIIFLLCPKLMEIFGKFIPEIEE